MSYPIPKTETRSAAEIRSHYELEKRLAAELKNASRDERRALYARLYDELYANVPYLKTHAMEANEAYVQTQRRGLKRYVTPSTVFLELGPGNLGLSLAMAAEVKQVYAVDVSDEFTRSLGRPLPGNMRLVLSDGTSVPVPPGSVSLAYSTQLMEHLHPEDAMEQLRNIFRALGKGGRYVCITPHRLLGPHDISRYFDEEATGFHLKEYTNRELASLFREAGFRRVQTFVGLKGWLLPCPLWVSTATERVLTVLPKKIRQPIANLLPMRALLGVRLVATK